MIELRMLGAVDVWSPDGTGAARVLSQPKRLAVLVYLAAAKPRGFQRRDTLLAVFWPELDQERARAALRNALHFLRRELSDGVILTRGDEVAVDATELWCDVTELDVALDAGDPGRALALYRGEFLKGLHVSDAPEFHRWADAERERLRRRARDGAWQLAGAHESASVGVTATHWMRLALDIDPDDEGGLHRLLRSLERAGDRAGAIREYERFARRLAEDYELEPSADTRALAEAIRSRSAGTSPHQPQPGASGAPLTSIVVLPFTTSNSSPGSEYYGDGLAEEIAVQLSTIPELRVIARASSARLRSTTMDAREIGAELNVQYALEGSVTREGDTLSVDARLLDTTTGAIAWAETYGGTSTDVFDIQDHLVRAIASKVQLSRANGRTERTRSRHQGSVHAYDCYHRAMHELSRFSEQGVARALEHVRNGLALVGENELLLATMAYVYIQFIELGVRPNRKYLEKAEQYAVRALAADPRSCLGHVARGLICYKRGDIDGTARDLKRALEIDPNQRDALFWLTLVYLTAGREMTARPLLARLLDLDPLTPVNHCLTGYVELLAGNTELALPGYRRMHRMDSSNPVARWFLAHTLGRCGRRAEALALLHQIRRDTPDTTFARHALFFTHALERNRNAALAAVTPELSSEARWDQHASWWMASTYALIDERDAALDWLSNASDLGYINYPFLSRFDPFFESLRRDDRFWQLMTRVKERWEHFTS
jgi:TolB-like protein/Flp pilus assembly protein TadD